MEEVQLQEEIVHYIQSFPDKFWAPRTFLRSQEAINKGAVLSYFLFDVHVEVGNYGPIGISLPTESFQVSNCPLS